VFLPTGITFYSLRHLYFLTASYEYSLRVLQYQMLESIRINYDRQYGKEKEKRVVGARILLVDDYKLWRSTVRSILEATRKFRIVGEASDGVEAIEMAATLLPDVVLLDIGLPKLNGIEAATKIRTTCPESKIIFFTQEQDSDVRSAALATGAAAYLVKSRAACELLQTIESVIVGSQRSPDPTEYTSLEPAILSRNAELCHAAIKPK